MAICLSVQLCMLIYNVSLITQGLKVVNILKIVFREAEICLFRDKSCRYGELLDNLAYKKKVHNEHIIFALKNELFSYQK